MSNDVGILLNPEAKAGWIPPKRESWLSGSLPTKVCGDGDGARPNSRNGAGVVAPELGWGLNNKLARFAQCSTTYYSSQFDPALMYTAPFLLPQFASLFKMFAAVYGVIPDFLAEFFAHQSKKHVEY